jgi:hypothetical protein
VLTIARAAAEPELDEAPVRVGCARDAIVVFDDDE